MEICVKNIQSLARFSREKGFEYVTILFRNENRKLGYEKKIAIKRENFHISVEERKLSKIFSEGGFDLKNRAAAAGFLKKQTDSR